MKKILISGLCLIILCSHVCLSQGNPKTALLLIDIQEFYFPGGFSELNNPEQAADNASLLLKKFRSDSILVVHVKHKTKEQNDIVKKVNPKENEKIIEKTEVSCFNGTDLHDFLQNHKIENLVIAGMMTHMCVEGACRAGHDLGYGITIISDACTTKDLEFGDKIIPAEHVHLSTLSTLKSYGEVLNTNEYLNIKK